MFIKQAQLMYKKQGCCGSYQPLPDDFSEAKKMAITVLAKQRPGDVVPIEGYNYGWFEATSLDLDTIEQAVSQIDGDTRLKALAQATLVLIQHVRALEDKLATRGELLPGPQDSMQTVKPGEGVTTNGG